MKLAVLVQHHPSRADLLPPLLERLPGAEVVSDPEPEVWGNALRTYRECLRRAPADATHVLVFQDDAWPCEGFRALAEGALSERPDDLICFFTPGSQGLRGPILRAAKQGEHWARVRTGAWVPTVATSYPAEIAAEFLERISRPRFLRERGDDGPLTQFCRLRKLTPWATVPCLVQHADWAESLTGLKTSQGRNPARTAALYVGDDDPRIAPAAHPAKRSLSTNAA